MRGIVVSVRNEGGFAAPHYIFGDEMAPHQDQKERVPIRPDTLAALAKLSLKQHAVVLGILHGMRNVRIAELMHCDRTIVSSHLNAALTHLRCTDRHHLKEVWAERVEQISEAAYREHFGVRKRWFEILDPVELELLRRKQSKGGKAAKKDKAG